MFYRSIKPEYIGYKTMFFLFGWSNSITVIRSFRWFDDINYLREALSLEVVHLILFIFFKCEIK